MDIQKEQKNNTDLFKEKIDTNLLNGSIEIILLNRIYKKQLINEKIYKQAILSKNFNELLHLNVELLINTILNNKRVLLMFGISELVKINKIS